MRTCKKIKFVALTLLAISCMVLQILFHRHHKRFINSIRTASYPSEIYRDLSVEFEESRVQVGDRVSVLEALKRDGYTPVAISGSTTGFSNVLLSTKQPTNDPHNHSPADSEGLNNDGSRNNRCNPVDGQENSMQVLRVPNVVHYVFLGSHLNFTFINYLSFRSIDRFIRPDQVFFHSDHTPSGKWWNRTIDEVKNIYHVKRTYSNKAPNGQPYNFPTDVADYMRAGTLLNYGGIYMDADVLVVKSFTPLRQFPFVIGRETSYGLCNGIMVAERGAPFLRLLLEQYHSYLGPDEPWSAKPAINVDKIARLYPHLVHIEETTLNRPNWEEKAQIYDGWYNWTQNYAVHLWVRMWPYEKRPNRVEDILTRNTTFGELARRAIFGSHEIKNITTNLTNI